MSYLRIKFLIFSGVLFFFNLQSIYANQCAKLMASYVKSYYDLYQQLPVKDGIDHSYYALKLKNLYPKADVCMTNQASITASLIEETWGIHQQKIAMFLPANPSYRSMNNAIRRAFSENKLLNDRMDYYEFIQPSKLQALISQAVFKGKAGLFVSALPLEQSKIIAEWSRRLAIPTVYLNSKIPVNAVSQLSLNIFPSKTSMTELLVDKLIAFGHQQVGLVHSKSKSSVNFAAQLSKIAFSKGLRLKFAVSYDPHNFQSMKTTAEQVLNIDYQLRAGEYADLVETERQLYELEGKIFNSDHVVLKPLISFDALILIDHFKNVKHLIRIFQSLDADPFPIYGHHQWRAKELIEPYDAFMDGAKFVDFISPTMISMDMSDIEYSDWYQISKRAGFLLNPLMQKKFKRHHQAAQLKKFHYPKQDQFTAGKAFDTAGSSLWPAFMYSVGREQFKLLAKSF